jgi:hypothetical protein
MMNFWCAIGEEHSFLLSLLPLSPPPEKRTSTFIFNLDLAAATALGAVAED